MLGNGQADGGRGAVTHMFKDRKFDFVPFDQTHNPRVEKRLREKKKASLSKIRSHAVSLTSSVVNTIFSTEEK